MPSLRKATVETAAKFFGRDVRTIQNWVKEGMPKTDRGEYDLMKCSRWYIHKLRKEMASMKQGDQTLYRMKKQEQEMKNKEREIRLKKLGGDYIEFNLVKNSWLVVVKIILKYLDNLPIRVKNKYVIDETMFKNLREAVKDLRKDIATLTPEDFMKELEDYDKATNEVTEGEEIE